jgi:DNA-binding CsgD family transcriptional regulator
MYIRSAKIKLVTTLLLLFNISLYCEPETYILKKEVYIDKTNTLGFPKIIELYKEDAFSVLSKSFLLESTVTYWVYIKTLADSGKNNWVLNIDKPVSEFWLYTFDNNKLVGYSGNLVPTYLRQLDKNNILLKNGTNEYLLKIKNNFFARVSLDDINIIPAKQYIVSKQNQNIIQGIVQGILWFMLIYNLFFYIFTRRKVYFFFVFYVLLNSVFLLNAFNYLEQFFFPSLPCLYFSMMSFQLIGLFFYFLFLRTILTDNYKGNIWFLSSRLFIFYCILTLGFHLSIGILSYFNPIVFVKSYALVNLYHGLTAFGFFIPLFKKVSIAAKYVIIGSVIMIVGGFFTVLPDIFYFPSNHYPYEIGLVAEIMIFSFVLNMMHRRHENEKLIAIKQNTQLNLTLENRNNELMAYTTMLVKDNEANIRLISSLKDLLPKANIKDKKVIDSFNSVLNDYEIRVNNKSWNEFEFRFKCIYGTFYSKLLEKYPDLTPNEIKLATLLRLNLSSKQISAITGQSPETIKMGRYRLRKKMNIPTNENLIAFLINMH